MSLYHVGDRVELSDAVAEYTGGAAAVGYVTELVGGPQGEGSYRVERHYGEGDEYSGIVVPEDQITAGPLPAPKVFLVGQPVLLAGEDGTIVSIVGEVAAVDVAVDLRWRRNKLGRVACVRRHHVPLWRLLLEN